MAMVDSFTWIVRRSFLDQSDHPITVPKEYSDAVQVLVGNLDHARLMVPMVNMLGEMLDASIRHSVSGYGDYYQINSRDSASTAGLHLDHMIRVELWADPSEIRLLAN